MDIIPVGLLTAGNTNMIPVNLNHRPRIGQLSGKTFYFLHNYNRFRKLSIRSKPFVISPVEVA